MAGSVVEELQLRSEVSKLQELLKKEREKSKKNLHKLMAAVKDHRDLQKAKAALQEENESLRKAAASAASDAAAGTMAAVKRAQDEAAARASEQQISAVQEAVQLVSARAAAEQEAARVRAAAEQAAAVAEAAEAAMARAAAERAVRSAAEKAAAEREIEARAAGRAAAELAAEVRSLHAESASAREEATSWESAARQAQEQLRVVTQELTECREALSVERTQVATLADSLASRSGDVPSLLDEYTRYVAELQEILSVSEGRLPSDVAQTAGVVAARRVAHLEGQLRELDAELLEMRVERDDALEEAAAGCASVLEARASMEETAEAIWAERQAAAETMQAALAEARIEAREREDAASARAARAAEERMTVAMEAARAEAVASCSVIRTLGSPIGVFAERSSRGGRAGNNVPVTLWIPVQ
jgi:hypothetical protein